MAGADGRPRRGRMGRMPADAVREVQGADPARRDHAPAAVPGKAEDGRAVEQGPVRADGASEREIEEAIRRNLRRMADIGGSFVLMQERR